MNEVASTGTLDTLMGLQISLGSIMYLIAGSVATWLGWKAVKGTAKFAYGQAKNIGVGMVGMSALLLAGLTGAGYSFGELQTRGDKPITVSQKHFIEDGAINFKDVTAKIDEEGNLYPSTLSESELIIWKTLDDDQKSLIWSTEKTDSSQQKFTEASYEAPISDPFEVKEEIVGLDDPQVPLRQTWAILFGSIGTIVVSALAYHRKNKKEEKDDKINPNDYNKHSIG